MESCKVMIFQIILMMILGLGHTQSMSGGGDNIYNVFLLAGQSNMAGRGSLSVPCNDCQPNPKIRRFTANGTWEDAHDPLHKDIDVAKAQFCGVGPGMPFSNTLLKRKGDLGVIGLVPCAVGATSIAQWSKGRPLYDALLSRAAAAVRTGGVIRALLWYQGEADTQDPENARLYKSRFQQFINDVRPDLGSPSLPFIEVALEDDYTTSNGSIQLEEVRKAQLDTAAELPNVKCVDAKALPVQPPEYVHLTTPSQVVVGGMMADAFLQLSQE